MKVNGKCLCGQVTFSAEVDESKVMLCHCTDCQVQASTAFRIGALINSGTFSMQGEVKEYCKIGTTGARRMQVFCPSCATGIYSYTPDNPAPVYSLRLGAVEQLRQLRPAIQIWGRSALPWLPVLQDIPCVMEQEVVAQSLKPTA
ncbi:MAG TPA: GFA family protein [Pseudomonas sp.]|nr:GFA family protein [Pseudomonas sp.]